MDRFVPAIDYSSEMTRHLRPVPDVVEGAAYVVGRSQHVRPGTPFVIACCIDRGVAAIFALAGQEVCSREEMEREPALAAALRAWEADDESLFRMEHKARAAFGRERWHPSRMRNIQT